LRKEEEEEEEEISYSENKRSREGKHQQGAAHEDPFR